MQGFQCIDAGSINIIDRTHAEQHATDIVIGTAARDDKTLQCRTSQEIQRRIDAHRQHIRCQAR
ncbi:hypothetical protein D3C81_2200700 [compost metagenome]